MRQLECRTGTDAVEGSFDRGLLRREALDDEGELGVQSRQPFREGAPRQIDRSAPGETWMVGGADDDGPAGAPRARVDAQDAALVAQEASSLSAASSNERFA